MTAKRDHRMFDPVAPTLTGKRLGWHEQAACAGMSQALFYPSAGEDNRAAKAVCERCPVRATCLTEAMRVEEGVTYRFGVLGGLSPYERGRLARRGWRAGDELPPVNYRRGPGSAA